MTTAKKTYNSVENYNAMVAHSVENFAELQETQAATLAMDKYLQVLEQKTLAVKAERAIKQLENTVKKYGTTELIEKSLKEKRAIENNALEKEKVFQAELAAMSYNLTEREKNNCIARSFYDRGKGGILFPFIGDDMERYNDTVERVTTALQAVIERCGNLDKVAMSDKGAKWLQILDKHEYRTLKKALEYIDFGLYQQGMKYSADDVFALFHACIISRKGETTVTAHDKILKELVTIINLKNLSPLEKQDNGKKSLRK